ncbi:hypothetical protein LCGC14_0468030, partial [marine sediment metagenome]
LQISPTVTTFLKSNPEKKFTAREIADWIRLHHAQACEQKLSQSKNKRLEEVANEQDRIAVLIQILVAEIGAQRPNIQKKTPQIKITDSRPRKYYYTDKTDDAEVEAIENKQVNSDSLPLEHDLYPMLVEYLKAEHSLYAKRIDEKRSTNNRGTKGNEWLYPDLVALEDLASEWSADVANCAANYGAKKAKLWSFEVKRLINTSNVRSAFFQAVSNSSWANFGYLVAAELGDNAKKELRMLASLHGIGFILLDTDTPSESQIMIPAREKTDLDWDSINRLAQANKDFTVYIEDLKDFCLTGKAKVSDWD